MHTLQGSVQIQEEDASTALGLRSHFTLAASAQLAAAGAQTWTLHPRSFFTHICAELGGVGALPPAFLRSLVFSS